MSPCLGVAVVLALAIVTTTNADTTVPASSSEVSNVCRAWNVLITRRSDTYHPRIYRALLATDGSHHRIAFYWLDPTARCEVMDALVYSDFLFDTDRVSYWHHGDPNQTQTVLWEQLKSDEAGCLRMDNTFASVLQSVFTLVLLNMGIHSNRSSKMESTRFFEIASQRACFDLTAASAGDEVAGSLLSEWAQGDYGLFDHLPFGRRYSKDVDAEENVVWRLSKAGVPPRIMVKVVVRPVPSRTPQGWADMSDPNTLGHWTGVPRAYRQYWEWVQRYTEIRRSRDIQRLGGLCEDVRDCLLGPLPDDLKLAQHRLLYDASLQTNSGETIASSAREYFNAYVLLAQEPVECVVAELGYICRDLRMTWSEDRTREFILPLLYSLVTSPVFSDPEFVDNMVLKRVRLQGQISSWYSALLVEAVHRVNSLPQESMTDTFENTRHSFRTAGTEEADPNRLVLPKICAEED